MIFVDYILQWARGRGYTSVYGSAEQVNEMLTGVPFSESKDGIVVIMHLIADSETVDGHDRALLAVYFASLCPFDFDGESLLPEQERLKGVGKELLNDIRHGNILTCGSPRWQYGYDDYAENVAWCCMRVTLTALAADCVPLVIPEPPASEMIPVPEIAADLFRLFSEGEIEPTIRGGVLAEAFIEGEYDTVSIVFTGVMPPPSKGMVTPYVVLNGESKIIKPQEPLQITEGMIDDFPYLSPYLGWYIYPLFVDKVTETRAFCVTVGFEGVYESPEICWEEG